MTGLKTWQKASGLDQESLVADPQFINPTGPASALSAYVSIANSAALVNLHLNPGSPAEGTGLEVGVQEDFDGEFRSTLSPTDLGADAGNFKN